MKEVDGKKYKDLVKEFNKQTGFTLKFDKNVDWSNKYQHPKHDDGMFVLTTQIDKDTDRVYGLRLKVNNIDVPFDSYNFGFTDKLVPVTYQELIDLSKTDHFKLRVAAIQQLSDLQDELIKQKQELENRLIEDSFNDKVKEDVYDTIMLAARKLYK